MNLRNWFNRNRNKYTARNDSVVSVSSEPAQNSPTLSLTLTDDAAEWLLKLATDQRITPDEAIRRAIATETHIYNERKLGSKVLILKPNKEVREILFR